MSSLAIRVIGLPGAQGSKRSFGPGRMVESSPRVAPWRQDVRAAALQAAGDDGWETATGPIEVRLTFLFKRPKSHYRSGRNSHLLRDNAPWYPTSRTIGDIDKLVRSTLDALTSAEIFADDSLVCDLGYARKRWAEWGQPSGALILVDRIDGLPW